MDAEVSRIGLPRGVWQKELIKLVPEAGEVTVEYPDDRTMVMTAYTSDRGRIVTFSMSFMYGCKGILISHGMEVSAVWRGQGIAKRLQSLKERIAKDLKASVLMATVRDDNEAEKSVIKNWKLVDVFTNFRTGNVINIYTRQVK